MSNPTYIAMGVGGVALVFSIFALANGGASEGDVSRLVSGEMDKASEQVEGLDARIAELESALAAAVAEAGSATDLAAVTDDVAALSASSEETQAAVAALTEQGDAISGEIAALAERVTGAETAAAGATEAAMAAASEAAGATEAAMAAASEAAAASASVAAAPAAPAAGSSAAATETATDDSGNNAVGGATAGQTVLFADGGLRIFVSRVMADEGAARLSVNGDSVTVGVGEARTVAVAEDYCRYTLEGVGDGVNLSALCGDELPAPEGLSPGETAILADGAVRAFASRITDDTARLIANQEMVTLAVGRSAPIPAADQNCRVAVDAIDRGHVSVSAACGDDVAVSEAAGVGSTVVLGDGAARVFVSKVTDEGDVRFAVNGQDMVMGASGDSVAAGESCMVTVEDVVERKASFSFACDG